MLAAIVLGYHERFVPPTDMHMGVIRGIKIVGLGIRIVVVVSRIHSLHDLGHQFQRIAGVMALEVIGVHLLIATGVRSESTRNLVGVLAASFIAVRNEVHRSRLDRASNGRIVALQGEFHTTALESLVQVRFDLRLALLVHVSHFSSFSMSKTL